MFDFIASDNNDKKNTVLWLKFYFSKKKRKAPFSYDQSNSVVW